MVTSSVRDEILAAATRIVAEQGAGGLRVDEVAALAGANKRMIYHYFGDRAGLLHQVVATQFAALIHDRSLPASLRRVVRRLRAWLNELDMVDATVSAPAAADGATAAAIVLRHCLGFAGAARQNNVRINMDRNEWQQGLADLMDLALHPPSAEPSPPRKPVIRVRSASRRTGGHQ